MFSWAQHGPDLVRRAFTGAVREAAGFVVRIEGIQRENGRCLRRVTVEAVSLSTRLDPEAVRQSASALTAAVDEIEAGRCPWCCLSGAEPSWDQLTAVSFRFGITLTRYSRLPSPAAPGRSGHHSAIEGDSSWSCISSG